MKLVPEISYLCWSQLIQHNVRLLIYLFLLITINKNGQNAFKNN